MNRSLDRFMVSLAPTPHALAVAVDLHGLDVLVRAAGEGRLLRLVCPWGWPDPNPFRRLRLFRWLP